MVLEVLYTPHVCRIYIVLLYCMFNSEAALLVVDLRECVGGNDFARRFIQIDEVCVACT